jgi:AcrR family transcriptional regulator
MSRKKEQRLASTQRLLDSALHLFVSQGYRSTNLEQIAGAAKLSKGAVYFYFGSKEAVLLELLGRVQAIVVDEALAAARKAGPKAADQIVAFLHHQANLGVTHRDEVLLLILMSLEFGGTRGAVSKTTRSIYQRLYAFVEKVIRAGRAAGELRADLSPRELASIIMANHDGTFLEWYRRSGSLRGTALVRALREVVLSGVKR